MSKGRCRYFAGRPQLVALAVDAMALASDAGQRHWRSRVGDITPQQVESVLVRAPEGLVSDATRMFCTKMLAINRRRLLDGT